MSSKPKKRIIPCLDFKDGKVVKGVQFEDIKDIGDPAVIGKAYCDQGADELVFLDIAATLEGRKTLLDAVERTVKAISVPLTVGGGISSIEDIYDLMLAGVQKVSINSAAVRDHSFLTGAALRFSREAVVLAIDAVRTASGKFEVVIDGGLTLTGMDVVEWAREGESCGAGEILLTSKSADGTRDGYDIEMTKAVADAVNIPVIASGGCGSLEHFADVFKKTKAEGALAASLFHYGDLTIPQVKEYLRGCGIKVR